MCPGVRVVTASIEQALRGRDEGRPGAEFGPLFSGREQLCTFVHEHPTGAVAPETAKDSINQRLTAGARRERNGSRRIWP